MPYKLEASAVRSETDLAKLCLSTAESTYRLGNLAAAREAAERGIAACDRANAVIARMAEGEQELLLPPIFFVRDALNELLGLVRLAPGSSADERPRGESP
jgi:hypothetical protein